MSPQYPFAQHIPATDCTAGVRAYRAGTESLKCRACSAATDRGRFSFMGGPGGPLWRRITYRLPPVPGSNPAAGNGGESLAGWDSPQQSANGTLRGQQEDQQQGGVPGSIHATTAALQMVAESDQAPVGVSGAQRVPGSIPGSETLSAFQQPPVSPLFPHHIQKNAAAVGEGMPAGGDSGKTGSQATWLDQLPGKDHLGLDRWISGQMSHDLEMLEHLLPFKASLNSNMNSSDIPRADSAVKTNPLVNLNPDLGSLYQSYMDGSGDDTTASLQSQTHANPCTSTPAERSNAHFDSRSNAKAGDGKQAHAELQGTLTIEDSAGEVVTETVGIWTFLRESLDRWKCAISDEAAEELPFNFWGGFVGRVFCPLGCCLPSLCRALFARACR